MIDWNDDPLAKVSATIDKANVEWYHQAFLAPKIDTTIKIRTLIRKAILELRTIEAGLSEETDK